MTASVVIATYGRPQEVRELLTQLHKYSPDAEIIVVDQAKTANLSSTEIARWSVIVIDQAEANLPRARNTGWKRSSSEVVIFFDDDVVLQPHTIAAHLEAYAIDMVGVAGRVINTRETIPRFTEVVTGTTDRFLLNFSWNFWSTKAQSVMYPYGCNMSFRRETLEQINGFDESLLPPMSAFEEVDCGLRARKWGQILFVPTAEVKHLQTESGGTRLPQRAKARSYWYCYGRVLRKHVNSFLLPLAIVRVLPRAIRESSAVVLPFFRGIVS